ncbi:MAG TPA: hypothetical protein VIY69_06960 [Candidatus Acidoferrales bacterium]
MMHRTTAASLVCVLVFSLLLLTPLSPRRWASGGEVQQKATTPVQNIVIGFVGGFVNQDNPVHAEVQLAARLRKAYSSGLDVETFQDHHVKLAHEKILSLLSGNSRSAPTPDEKRNPIIVLYGHSWGGAASLELARALQKDGIPVKLTIQVDSISRYGDNDSLIPANVLQAANFYQTQGILHGIRHIHAVDPSHTQIIGNFRFDYSHSSLKCESYPWWDRYIVKAHTQIECDPVVWNKVEALIREALPPPVATAK